MSRRLISLKLTPGEEALLDALREQYAAPDRARILRTALHCLANWCGLDPDLIERARKEREAQNMHYRLRRRVIADGKFLKTPRPAKGSRGR